MNHIQLTNPLIAGFDCLRIYGITQGIGRLLASFTVGLLGTICIIPVFVKIFPGTFSRNLII